MDSHGTIKAEHDFHDGINKDDIQSLEQYGGLSDEEMTNTIIEFLDSTETFYKTEIESSKKIIDQSSKFIQAELSKVDLKLHEYEKRIDTCVASDETKQYLKTFNQYTINGLLQQIGVKEVTGKQGASENGTQDGKKSEGITVQDLLSYGYEKVKGIISKKIIDLKVFIDNPDTTAVSPKPAPEATPGEEPGAQAKPEATPGEEPGAQAKPEAAPGEEPGAQAKPEAAPGEEPGAQAKPGAAPGEEPGAQAKPEAAPGAQGGGNPSVPVKSNADEKEDLKQKTQEVNIECLRVCLNLLDECVKMLESLAVSSDTISTNLEILNKLEKDTIVAPSPDSSSTSPNPSVPSIYLLINNARELIGGRKPGDFKSEYKLFEDIYNLVTVHTNPNDEVYKKMKDVISDVKKESKFEEGTLLDFLSSYNNISVILIGINKTMLTNIKFPDGKNYTIYYNAADIDNFIPSQIYKPYQCCLELLSSDFKSNIDLILDFSRLRQPDKITADTILFCHKYPNATYLWVTKENTAENFQVKHIPAMDVFELKITKKFMLINHRDMYDYTVLLCCLGNIYNEMFSAMRTYIENGNQEQLNNVLKHQSSLIPALNLLFKHSDSSEHQDKPVNASLYNGKNGYLSALLNQKTYFSTNIAINALPNYSDIYRYCEQFATIAEIYKFVRKYPHIQDIASDKDLPLTTNNDFLYRIYMDSLYTTFYKDMHPTLVDTFFAFKALSTKPLKEIIKGTTLSASYSRIHSLKNDQVDDTEKENLLVYKTFFQQYVTLFNIASDERLSEVLDGAKFQNIYVADGDFNETILQFLRHLKVIYKEHFKGSQLNVDDTLASINKHPLLEIFVLFTKENVMIEDGKEVKKTNWGMNTPLFKKMFFKYVKDVLIYTAFKGTTPGDDIDKELYSILVPNTGQVGGTTDTGNAVAAAVAAAATGETDGDLAANNGIEEVHIAAAASFSHTKKQKDETSSDQYFEAIKTGSAKLITNLSPLAVNSISKEALSTISDMIVANLKLYDDKLSVSTYQLRRGGLSELNFYKTPEDYIIPFYYLPTAKELISGTTEEKSLKQKIQETWVTLKGNATDSEFYRSILDVLKTRAMDIFSIKNIFEDPFMYLIINLNKYLDTDANASTKYLNTKKAISPFNDITTTLKSFFEFYSLEDDVYISEGLQQELSRQFFIYLPFLNSLKIKSGLVGKLKRFLLNTTSLDKFLQDIDKLASQLATDDSIAREIELLQSEYERFNKVDVNQQIIEMKNDPLKFYEYYRDTAKVVNFRKTVKQAVDSFKNLPEIAPHVKMLKLVCPLKDLQQLLGLPVTEATNDAELLQVLQAAPVGGAVNEEELIDQPLKRRRGRPSKKGAGPSFVQKALAQAKREFSSQTLVGKEYLLFGSIEEKSELSYIYNHIAGDANQRDAMFTGSTALQKVDKRTLNKLYFSAVAAFPNYIPLIGGNIEKRVSEKTVLQKNFGDMNKSKELLDYVVTLSSRVSQKSLLELRKEMVKNGEIPEISKELKPIQKVVITTQPKGLSEGQTEDPREDQSDAEKQRAEAVAKKLEEVREARDQHEIRTQIARDDLIKQSQAAAQQFGVQPTAPTSQTSQTSQQPSAIANKARESTPPASSNPQGSVVKTLTNAKRNKQVIKLKEDVQFIEDFVKYITDKGKQWLEDVEAVTIRDFPPVKAAVESFPKQEDESKKKAIKSMVKQFFVKFIKLLETRATTYYIFVKNFYTKDGRRKVREVIDFIEYFEKLAEFEKERTLVLKQSGGATGGATKDEFPAIKANFEESVKKISTTNDDYFTKLESFINKFAGPGNFLLLDDDIREKLTKKVTRLGEQIGAYKLKIKSFYRLNFSTMDVIFDAQFVILYLIKLTRILFVYVALFLTTKVFTPMYEEVVYDKKENPPPLTKFLLIFLAFDLSFNVFILIVLFLLKFLFKTEDNSFPVDSYLFGKYAIDYAFGVTFVLLLSYMISSTIESKKYFKYKYEGLRAIRAYQDMMFKITVPVFLFPFFWLV